MSTLVETFMTVRRSPFSRTAVRIAAAACMALGLGACQTDALWLTEPPPSDVRVRHPLLLAEAPRSLDLIGISLGDGGLRQRRDLVAFVSAYRREGRSAVEALWLGPPQPDQRAQQRLESQIRSHLAGYGLKAHEIRFETAPPGRSGDALPVLRLSYLALQAVVPTPCGSQRGDAGGIARYERDILNLPPADFGCASQAAFALTVDDPVDLVRPRLETPADLPTRLRAIDGLRQGRESAAGSSSSGSASNAATAP
jgi:pilus assembly protein CpaD